MIQKESRAKARSEENEIEKTKKKKAMVSSQYVGKIKSIQKVSSLNRPHMHLDLVQRRLQTNIVLELMLMFVYC